MESKKKMFCEYEAITQINYENIVAENTSKIIFDFII